MKKIDICDLINHEPVVEIKEPVENVQKESNEKKTNSGAWTCTEHELFLKGHQIHGRNWAIISKEFVKTRSRMQVASHAQKYFQKEIKKQQKTLKYHFYIPNFCK